MTTDREVQARLQALRLEAFKACCKMVTEPNTAATNRLKGVELLLRVARGPSEPSAREARTALALSVPFLDQIAKSHTSERIRSRATRLADRARELDEQTNGSNLGPKG
jgi:hypothetical protein